MSTYILLPHGSTSLPTQVGRVSLDLYRTSGDPHLGLFINVLALYGFWRMGPGPELPKDVISGWPFLMVAILLVIGAGVWLAVRRGTHRPELLAENSSSENGRLKSGVVQFQSRQGKVHESLALSEYKPYLALLLIFIGFVGFFLALGDQGPTGWLFLWAYDHVTFFALMREPQKFVMLLALSYAVFFGWGVGHLAQLKLSFSRIRNLAMVTVVGVALPLGYSANIFDGLSGQIAPSSVPVSYQQADRLMGMGAGTVLYVPWHLYMSYPFTNNRVVANIGASEFRRTVISGDNVESGDVESQSTSPRSTYLQQLFSDGPHLREFGALVAPLGVQYVVLAKTVDWVSYSWLGNQDDLTMILNTSSLEVWRNDDYAGVGWRATKLTPVSGVGGLVILSKIDGLAGRALITKGTVANSLNPDPQHSTQEATGSPPSSPSVIELSPVAYRISSGTSSWVTVDVPYQRGWSLDGRAATESAEGTLLIHVGPRGGELQFTPWSLVRLGYILSTSTFLVLLGIVLCGGQVDRRRRASAGEKSKFRGK
jgi:hypothetical protein